MQTILRPEPVCLPPASSHRASGEGFLEEVASEDDAEGAVEWELCSDGQRGRWEDKERPVWLAQTPGSMEAGRGQIGNSQLSSWDGDSAEMGVPGKDTNLAGPFGKQSWEQSLGRL